MLVALYCENYYKFGMKKIALILLTAFSIFTHSSFASASSKGYFEEVGFSELENNVLMKFLLRLELEFKAGKLSSPYEKETLVTFVDKMFEGFPENEVKQTVEKLTGVKNNQKPSVQFIDYYLKRIDELSKSVESRFQYLSKNETVVTDKKRMIAMAMPGFDITMELQALLMMKTLTDETRISRVPELTDEERKQYYDIVEPKSNRYESALKEYGIYMPEKFYSSHITFEKIADLVLSSRIISSLEWTNMHAAIKAQGFFVNAIKVQQKIPNFVFMRDYFFSLDGKYFPSNFTIGPGERGPTSNALKSYFVDQTFKLNPTDVDVFSLGLSGVDLDSPIEGGDFLYDPSRNIIWVGNSDYLPSVDAAAEISAKLEKKTVVLEKKIFENHLDMFLASVGRFVLYYPPAFTNESIKKIESIVKPEDRIILTEEEYKKGSANLLKLDQHLFMSYVSPQVRERLTKEGYQIHVVNINTYLLEASNGGVHCMTNEIPLNLPD